MKTNIKLQKQSGFSLLELMLVVLLLSIVVGALFSQIDRAQVRYRVEDQKLDITQQEREFIDQFTRDLHQAGFPAPTLYGNQFNLNSQFTAAGVWSVSPTEVHLEGDVDGDGTADVVVYSYVAAAAGSNCPCLRRSQTPKVDGVAPSAQVPGAAFTQVENIVPLAAQPIFAAYDINGNNLIAGGGTLTDPNGIKTVRSIRITLTTQSLGQGTHAPQH